MALRWSDFITPSTLQLSPLVELLLEPISCLQLQSQLQLGLQEALVNAVRHGNGCDPGKCLRVRRIETPRWVIWQVQDEGPGLPPHARAGHLPEQLDATGGRGLFLIHHCFDDVRWSQRGNRLQLAIRRRPAPLISRVAPSPPFHRGVGSRGR
ncbi:ATP-binding protein [Synechococcus sp. GFB01]|uniref:ATP-binding protein n=1 Tax=Synechococcus sp. GFB01 TaxID=1662190 RepID=UPI00064EFADB|nr:ATP-binding protein [Synechococcus sp. GFB01]KMM17724.1 anti-sigma regulatory factor [Synechococcus sp. GFB01]